METRICNVCGLEKPLSVEFYRKSVFVRADGTEGISFMRKCLVCHNIWQMERYLKPKEDDGYRTCKHCGKRGLNGEFETAFMCLICFKSKKSKQNKEYKQTNKELRSISDKEYQEINKADIAASKREYYIKNRERFLKKAALYRENKIATDPSFLEKERNRVRKPKTAEDKRLRNEWRREQRKIDPVYRLRTIISKSVWGALKKGGGSKAGRSFTEKFSYSMEDLKLHIEQQFEPWMNWGNQGHYKSSEWDDNNPLTWKWQIDHIIPRSDLPFATLDDENLKKCWALSNLRPYSAKQNMLDGLTRVRHKNQIRYN